MAVFPPHIPLGGQRNLKILLVFVIGFALFAVLVWLM
jgi:hypothetical protein